MNKLSAKERERLRKMAKKPDDTIDLSDIPEITRLPSDATLGKFYRPVKQSVTIRLDSDLVAWLKASGTGYQTRVNEYLRELMTRNRKPR
ncbi:MAG: BrnA antitoxin family protein [Bryobacteraceae bacterium]|nr:BrnA antitoxin family protein [Bryobacteraceae bacterium]